MMYHKVIQLQKIIKYSLLVLFISSPGWVNAQKILKTDSGQKVLLAKDGSWSIVKFDQKIDKNGNIISDTSTNLDAFQAPTAGKYPLTVEQSSTINNMLKAFLSDEAQLLVNTEFFKDNLASLKAKLKVAEDEKDQDAEEYTKSQIKVTKASLKANKEAYKKSTKLIKRANELLDGKVKNSEESIANLIQETEDPEIVKSGMGGISEEVKTQDNNIEEETTEIISKQNDAGSAKIKKVSYPKTFKVDKKNQQRSSTDCVLSFDGYDESLGSKKKEVESAFFFGFSQPKMKAYFKEEDFITCNAFLSKVGKKHYITMQFRIKSKDAKKTYGMIRANETIRFEMVDGTKVYCKSMVQDAGTIEAYTGNTLYTGIFEIEKDDIGILKKSYLDNVGVIWSSGYEQYNIYNVDFLKNQFQCLEK